MSGHSKWATIKHKKGAADAKRGKLFSKFIKEIAVAAKMGGGDTDKNPRLRTVIEKARAANMPSDNVVRAIKRGTGELEGVTYEEVTYEGYGPAGVAMLIQCLTDNNKRTVAELRHLISKGGGNLGEAGCVAWMFNKKGVLTFDKTVGEDKLMEVALEAGAEDIRDLDTAFEVITDPNSFDPVKKACDSAGLKPIEAGIEMVPQNEINLSGDDARKMLNLMENLEDHDDVQNVFANFDIDASEMEKIA
ncbi:MAG: YebC/PmpR family DNA-binding transcriptional regulator [Deltaproteobacteria bacterium]|nr:YebC/PmpR family DNA-binding transcriptional regulator [Deltaproteobacteria bacterium]